MNLNLFTSETLPVRPAKEPKPKTWVGFNRKAGEIVFSGEVVDALKLTNDQLLSFGQDTTRSQDFYLAIGHPKGYRLRVYNGAKGRSYIKHPDLVEKILSQFPDYKGFNQLRFKLTIEGELFKYDGGGNVTIYPILTKAAILKK